MEQSVITFAYKNIGQVEQLRNAGYHIVDCRILANPWTLPSLRDLPGNDARVIEFVLAQSKRGLVQKLLNDAIGHNRIAFGCYGGVHRSVVMAKLFSDKINQNQP